MPTAATFLGVPLGYLKIAESEGTPQRIQTDNFDHVDGAVALNHGRKERQFALDGILTATNTTGAYLVIITAVGNIQELIQQVGTLVLPVGDTSRNFLYCRLDDFRRTSGFGFNKNLLITKVRATFTQLSW